MILCLAPWAKNPWAPMSRLLKMVDLLFVDSERGPKKKLANPEKQALVAPTRLSKKSQLRGPDVMACEKHTPREASGLYTRWFQGAW